MFVNFDKTDFMIQSTRQRLNNSYQIILNLDDSQIKQTCTQKLFGIRIDDKLTWTTHIDHLCSTISSKISLLRQLFFDFSLTVRAAPHECAIRTGQPKTKVKAENEAWFYYHLAPLSQYRRKTHYLVLKTPAK